METRDDSTTWSDSVPEAEPAPAAAASFDQEVGSWRMRRRVMAASLLFCKVVVAYVLYYDMESSVAETAVTMSFMTIISVVGSYVFGAAWEDVNARRVGFDAGRARNPRRGAGLLPGTGRGRGRF